MSNELITDVVIRDYRSSDATAIVKLFYETVHLVNWRDYSPEQIEAWAPEIPDPEKWDH
jgi:putative acetyltransferase